MILAGQRENGLKCINNYNEITKTTFQFHSPYFLTYDFSMELLRNVPSTDQPNNFLKSSCEGERKLMESNHDAPSLHLL